MITISSHHFGSIQIEGKQEKEAATYLSAHLPTQPKHRKYLHITLHSNFMMSLLQPQTAI